MNHRLLAAHLLLCCALLAPPVDAQTYTDDFESYATGSLIEGQGGWHGWDGVPDTTTRVVGGPALSGTRSLRYASGTDVVQEFDYHSGKVTVSANVWVADSTIVGNTVWLVFMNKYSDGGPHEWGAQVEFDGLFDNATFDCGGVSSFVRPIIVSTWFEVRLELDLDLDLASIYLNGLFVGSWTWTDGWSGMEGYATPGFEALDVWGPGSGLAFLDDVRVEHSGLGTPFCDADGQGTPCPCGNDHDGSAAVAGCANGSSPGGAALRASGSASLAAADFALVADGLVPNQPGLFFQGDTQLGGGDGAVFGDGLRCAGTNVVRLQVAAANGAGHSTTTIDVGATGGASPADTKQYQLWYRDPMGTLCGSAFNLTNGLELVWAP